LNAQQDALKSGQQLEQQSGAFIAEIQADYANILNRLGRGQEAQKILEESLKTARAGQNEALAAKILNFQGQTSYYRGDFKAARPLFEQARQSAAKAKDRIQTLSVGINLSRLTVKEGHAGAALSALKNSCKEADSLGVKFIAADCSMTLGEGLLETKDYAGAQSELQAVIRKSDEAGMKSLLPEAHYLLSQALRKVGNTSEADRHSQMASQLVKQMRDESGSEALLNRVDLKPIATQGAK
jgi:tetratricopeptide (TPR) repeat protein